MDTSIESGRTESVVPDADDGWKRVLVYGASTPVGTSIVRAISLLGNTHVIAADRVWVGHLATDNVTVSKFELADISSSPRSRERAGPQHYDVVVLALYSAETLSAWGLTNLYSSAVHTLLAHPKLFDRIIVTSAAALVRGGLWSELMRRVNVHTFIDLARMETILEENAKKNGKQPSFTFTVVRLPMCSHEPPSAFHVFNSTDKTYAKKDKKFRIGTQDVGLFVAREIHKPQWLNAYPTPSYYH